MEVLPIKTSHISKSLALPFLHRDPFDRLLFSQSLVENIHFLYTDKIFDSYRQLK